MQKISIKREQSQAGLSFAEREKFRPQVKNKLLLLLALLMTAATGAWADETYPIVYDFEAVANAGENPASKNGSGINGQMFYGWENETAKDRGRQDYKGYLYAEGSVLPEVCHVWRRSDPINGNVSAYNGGLKCPNNRLMAVDGLTEGLTVTIIYDATNATNKEIVWAIGDGSSESLGEPRAKAIINGAEAVAGTTTIKSGDVITVTKVTPAKNGSGYIVFAVKENMVIKKIIIDKAASGYTVTMKSGVKDADKWTVKVGEGQAQALPIGGLTGDGSETVTLQYNGRRKVKGVKATSEAGAPAAKPAATVTEAPTGAAIVGVGKTTALVSGGEADGGTLMYAVTTTNTKPASTDGFSGTEPTAKTITASGTVYVWYYVKGDDTHTDSEIAATAIEVPVADIVWDATNVSELMLFGNYEPYAMEGVKLSANGKQIAARWFDFGDPTMDGISFDAMESGGYTFTAPTGKAFTKIEMKPRGQGGWDFANLGTGWTFNQYFNEETEEPIFTVTWTGSAASMVDLLKDAGNFNGEYVKYIAFYLSE